MILMLLMVPYEIEAGSVEIVNRNKNIFTDGVKVYSESLYIEADRGVETSTSLELFDNVYVISKKIHFKANRLLYHTPYKKLYAGGDIKIWRQDTLKGDSLIFEREKETGMMFRNLLYISDSITVKGNSGFFHKDTVIVKGKPRFNSPEMTVDSDSIIYYASDSTFIFLGSVFFEGSEVRGSGGKLEHSAQKKHSILSSSPYIFQKRDSITGERIDIYHNSKILNVFKGMTINYTEEGRNKVLGDTVKVYYNEKSIDSVLVLQNAWGEFVKSETGIKESR